MQGVTRDRVTAEDEFPRYCISVYDELGLPVCLWSNFSHFS